MDSIYLQPVYVYFAGNGQSKYFTAFNDSAAQKFLFDYDTENKHRSCFKTIVMIQANDSYWLRNGISICNQNNLLSV